MLSENPKIADRLRREIMEKVGPSNMPTYENIREMKFLRAFLNGMTPHFSDFLNAKALYGIWQRSCGSTPLCKFCMLIQFGHHSDELVVPLTGAQPTRA